MKWRRKLKGAARACFHILLVGGPLWALRTTTWPLPGVVWVALLAIAFALLVRSAFIYIPGFDPLFRVPWRGPRHGRKMAITFDDGPNGHFTESVLALLERYGARATFFMIGENVDRQPDLARTVAASGHVVGSHTYSHRKLSQIPHAEAVVEIDRGRDALARAGIADERLFRAPHGLKTFALVRHLRRQGIRLIAWTAGVFDTDCPSGSVIARRARRWVRPGAILLLHDGKQGHDRRPLLHALGEILELARVRRIQLVSVPELLEWR